MTTIGELKSKVKAHHGAIARIALESGVSDQWVRKVLNGGFLGKSASVVIRVAVKVCNDMDIERSEKIKKREAAKQDLNNQVAMAFSEICA